MGLSIPNLGPTSRLEMERTPHPLSSTTELAALIKSRAVSPVEAAEAYLDRVDQIHGQINS
jgi:hypothetical protein